MRTHKLGRKALWLGALALLGGAGAARAQYNAGYGYPGYGQSAYGYYPGYGYYPNYGYYNPYYYAGQGYPGSQGSQAAAPSGYPQANGYPSGTTMGLGGLPLSRDEIPDVEDPTIKPKPPVEKEPCERFWLSAGYDSSWVKPMRLNTPLITTGSPGAPPGVDPTTYHAAGLGQPSTVVLFGDRNVDFGHINGIRASAGLFIDDDNRVSVEGTGFVQFARHQSYAASSDANGNPVIARPFFDALNNTETALPAGFPMGFAPLASTGSVSVDTRTELLGAEANARYDFKPAERFHLQALAGFRYLRLSESLSIQDRVTTLEPGFTFASNPLAAGDQLSDFDKFSTTNQFYGGQVGMGFGWSGKWVQVGGFGKIAVGATDQEVGITGGSTVHSSSLGTMSAPVGLYAQPSNIGRHSRTEFDFVPEGGINFGVRLLPCLRLTCGYSFLYWNSVVRPGSQIDRVVNPQTIPSDQFFGVSGGPVRPVFRFVDENYWVHTVNVGLTFHY
ncbi:MAG TPA: BBP7 family outer membrane beta-barrel protein [Gemmataceae bacterium]|nr:BBP7 family outer membrane beta-barrel protein [Gemmataceae bacterium]